MNQITEAGIFLRRTTNHGEVPNGVFPMINVLHFHHREVVLQTVIAQVVAERTFRFFLAFANDTRDHKIGIARQEKVILPGIAKAPPAEQPRERQFGQTFRQGHDRRERMRRRTTHEDRGAEGLIVGIV